MSETQLILTTPANTSVIFTAAELLKLDTLRKSAPTPNIKPTINPAEVAKFDLGDALLEGLKKSVEEAQTWEPTRQHQRLKQLSLGFIRKSKVLGVTSITKVEELIMDCASAGFITKEPHPFHAGLTVYRFARPANWKAFARCIKLGELLAINSKFNTYVQPVVVRRGNQRFVRFHAPQLSPFATDIITFIYNENTSQLDNWFAGEDPSLFQPSSNESVWVHCGVDLAEEK